MSRCPRPDKRSYASKAEALEVIRAMYRTGNGNPDLNAYGCVCGAVHIGHNPAHLRKRIQRALRINRPRRRK